MPVVLPPSWHELLDHIRSQPGDAALTALNSFAFDALPDECFYFAQALYHRIHSDLGQAEQAIARALEASAIRGNTAIYSDSLLLQSFVSYSRFDSAAAFEALRRAQQIKSEIGDVTGQIKILCNLANLAISQQKLSEAREAHQQASALYHSLPVTEQDALLELYLLNIDGLILEQLGDYQAAAQSYRFGLIKSTEAGLDKLEVSFGLNYYEALASLPEHAADPELFQRFEEFLGRRHVRESVQQSLAPARIYRAMGNSDAALQYALAMVQGARVQGNASLELEATVEVARAATSSQLIEKPEVINVLAMAKKSQRLPEALTILKFIVNDPRFTEEERLNVYYPELVEVQQTIFDAVRDQAVQNLTRQAGIENARRIAQYEQELRFQAEKTIQRQIEELERGRLFDALTGLPNRVMLLAQVAQQVRAPAEPFALLTLDLNRFQLINDTYGHDFADEVLRIVAQRLQHLLLPGELVARVGGDEFALLLTVREDLRVRADEVVRAVARPIKYADQVVRISGSAGAACWPQDASDGEALRRASELALLDAKTHGEVMTFFDAKAHAHAGLEGDLARALDRGEYELHFQPLVNTQAQRVVSAEALLRWNSSEHGLQFPGTFMPILERGDHIVEVGAWVLREACRAAQGWGGVRVAVNLSARQFASPDLLDTVRSALRESGLAPQLLELEVTESLMMLNPERTARILSALRDDGIHVMLDDFGTGYSSLAYLSQFPLSGLKVDRTFVQQMMREPRGPSAAIVRAMVSLSRDLGLELVAEGVETLNDVETLSGEGIQVMQGYYFARPTRDWKPLNFTASSRPTP
ncbi:bifunctional diguanylate cyclase/phosphodiesterase [Deinococcus radiotolerans]|uniref:Diguanylate cyclase n=1 Tax=Deinococcus radiotolerans TaxID=1309407 RepID=A0ABQ2FJI3_9DEIO|nr:bifunctional diguanylate cyclase/phosphodiesterase [Deinococcus radiotolerans]GGL00811.1 hypothetical protein GCM10010844_19100 [Deinococcus radiotolerans]